MKESKSDWIDDKCPDCHGTGSLVRARPAQFGKPIISPPPCPACGGTGRKKRATKD